MKSHVDIGDGSSAEIVDEFCYLGDTSVEAAVTATICSWFKVEVTGLLSHCQRFSLVCVRKSLWSVCTSVHVTSLHYQLIMPFTPLHLLRTHRWQLMQCIEFEPTPLPQTPHGHFCTVFFVLRLCPPNISLVLDKFTLNPFPQPYLQALNPET